MAQRARALCWRVMAACGVATPLCLVAGLATGIRSGSIVHGGLPGLMANMTSAMAPVTAMLGASIVTPA